MLYTVPPLFFCAGRGGRGDRVWVVRVWVVVWVAGCLGVGWCSGLSGRGLGGCPGGSGVGSGLSGIGWSCCLGGLGLVGVGVVVGGSGRIFRVGLSW